MPTTYRLLCLVLLTCCGIPGFSTASEPYQVFDPPRLPKDARLKLRWDLDHPAPFTGEFPNKEAWEKRAAAVREQILVSQGLWPMPAKGPLQPVIHGKIDRDEYTIEKVYFTSCPGHYVSGNLYRPKGKSGKLPGVLCPHGHYVNGRLMQYSEREARNSLQVGAESTKESAMYPLQARCAMLARMGCVVFFYDMVGVADSQAIAHRAGFNSTEAELRQQSAMGLQTWNSIRSLDFLLSLPDIDPERIAVTGSSGGGTQAFILAAIDNRIKLSAPAVMVSANMQGGCICENASHLRVGVNNVEIAALCAPRPQLLPSAQDWTHDIESRGLPELRKIYRLYGAEHLVAAKKFPFGHGYHQPMREYLYHFLNEHFKLGLPEPIKEKPFQPVPPAELHVYEKGQRPADELKADQLRPKLAAASDAQMAELAKSPDEYRRVVSTALRVLIHDDAPEVGQTVAKQLDFVSQPTYYIWKGTQSRKGEQEEIPTIALVPHDNNGTAVVWIHPQGKASLFDAKGELVPVARQLLEAKCAIIAPDIFLTGEYHQKDKPTPLPWLPQPHHKDIPFVGFVFGYNRSVCAERVRDIQTIVTHLHTRKDVKRVHLVAFGKVAPCALLARATLGKFVAKAVLDLDGWDFSRVKEHQDELLLPGVLKYGGLQGFLPLCTSGETHLFRPAAELTAATTLKTADVAFHPEELSPETLVGLVKAK
jgi:dienelactone hydrolase